MNGIERLAGTYEGTGVWHDSAGKSATYTIRQTNLATADDYIAWKEVLRRRD